MAQAGGRLQPRPQNPRGRGKDGGFFFGILGSCPRFSGSCVSREGRVNPPPAANEP